MVELLQKYVFGDMECRYYIDKETGGVELILVPANSSIVSWEEKKQTVDSLVQLKLAGDSYPGGYAGGRTMRQSGSVGLLCYKDQKVIKDGETTCVCTGLSYRESLSVRHLLTYREKTKYLLCRTEVENLSDTTCTVELLSSFSLGGITPFARGDGQDALQIHRIRSVWSMEGRAETRTVEELQLEPSWAGHAIRAERFGQTGSMPVNGYFPYLAVEDTRQKVLWGAMLAHNASWQMEIYRKDDALSVSGGLADREFGHWMKKLGAGERFETPWAILSVCRGDAEVLSDRLTEAMEPYLEAGPECEKELPVIFNEYCTTWGCPSSENIRRILDAIRGRGFSYFVIDCGWYKKEGIPWDVMMGDYEVSKTLFPEGLQKTVDAIKEAGLKPGIWFEIENVGESAEAYQRTEHLLHRDGEVLTTSMRRFWNMKEEWVQDYLTKKVIGTLKKYGFEYMKIDCNDTIGIGCDGAESLGEGLRQNMEASLAFLEKVKKEVPGIVLENCASGGHRLEPLSMSRMSMASFSDAHECEEIPIIAANLHRVILPAQSQIWAVIRKEDSLKRIAWSVASTFLGRMCISGDVTFLSKEQWRVIEEGIAFYKELVPVIRKGITRRYGTDQTAYRHPKGWQGVFRQGEDSAMVLIHIFEQTREIRIPVGTYKNWAIKKIYSDDAADVRLQGDELVCRTDESKKAIAVLLG
ncbi:MAG: alpha-galactosidase [Lachnospiraceae bacterium]|jgi:alpha-galactosidase|nr:alpha-galactosidase [Lachnospiraceae bacterium]